MLVDVFDDTYRLVGTADKATVHQQGSWHRTFSCLVVRSSDNSVLFQKKHPGQYCFSRPDYAEPITIAGHYHAGEEIAAGVREIEEELGVPNVPYEDLVSLGVRQSAVTLGDGYIDREFQHMHLWPNDAPLHSYLLGNAEVSGLVEVSIADAISLVDQDVESIPANCIHWPKGEASGNVFSSVLTYGELIPNYLRIDCLYLRLLIAARRFVDGDRDHLMW